MIDPFVPIFQCTRFTRSVQPSKKAKRARNRCLLPPSSGYTSAGWFFERGTYLTLVVQVWILLKASCHHARLECRPLSHTTLKAKQRVVHAIDRRLRWAKSCILGT